MLILLRVDKLSEVEKLEKLRCCFEVVQNICISAQNFVELADCSIVQDEFFVPLASILLVVHSGSRVFISALDIDLNLFHFLIIFIA